MKGDLTTLQKVKDWLGIPVTAQSDVLLQRLITSASSLVLSQTGKNGFDIQVYSDYMDGGGNDFIVLRQGPVISVESIQFGGRTFDTVAAGNPPTNGYLLQTPDSANYGLQMVRLFGARFPAGRQTILVTYKAGWLEDGEMMTVPSEAPYSAMTGMTWLSDQGVVYAASGTPLVAVPSSPAQGQYSVANGLYQFNIADAGVAVLVAYGYVPPDLDQVVCELVGERMKYRDRIGKNSESVGGQTTISFSTKDMSDYQKTVLNNYKRVTPV